MDINAQQLANRLIQLASRPVSPTFRESQSDNSNQINPTGIQSTSVESHSEEIPLLPVAQANTVASSQITNTNSNYKDFTQKLKAPAAINSHSPSAPPAEIVHQSEIVISHPPTFSNQSTTTSDNSTEHQKIIKNQQLIYKQFDLIHQKIAKDQNLIHQHTVNLTKHISHKLNSQNNNIVGFRVLLVIIVFLLLTVIALLLLHFFSNGLL